MTCDGDGRNSKFTQWINFALRYFVDMGVEPVKLYNFYYNQELAQFLKKLSYSLM